MDGRRLGRFQATWRGVGVAGLTVMMWVNYLASAWPLFVQKVVTLLILSSYLFITVPCLPAIRSTMERCQRREWRHWRHHDCGCHGALHVCRLSTFNPASSTKKSIAVREIGRVLDCSR